MGKFAWHRRTISAHPSRASWPHRELRLRPPNAWGNPATSRVRRGVSGYQVIYQEVSCHSHPTRCPRR
eukprot:1727132-Pyramimonas_sp.AAC.1